MSMFEVNLVPDVKRQLLRARNRKRIAMALSILVVGIGGGILLILGAVIASQAVISSNRDRDLEDAYMEFLANDNIVESLTIQNQLVHLQQVFDTKKEVSRIFPVMETILPDGDYRVALSSMNINFGNNTIYIDGQAQSVTLNDYVALESFEKTIERTTFDFGRYFTPNGEPIPTIYITEVIENGSVYGLYRQIGECVYVEQDDGTLEEECVEREPIRIKRYGSAPGENPNTNGFFFESACGAYEIVTATGARRVQSSCNLSELGLQVSDRTSGRNTVTNDVVLRFSGRLVIDPRVFLFENKHIYVIGPSRQIVTDSYNQVRDMFVERAVDCEPDDLECIRNNRGGN